MKVFEFPGLGTFTVYRFLSELCETQLLAFSARTPLNEIIVHIVLCEPVYGLPLVSMTYIHFTNWNSDPVPVGFF